MKYLILLALLTGSLFAQSVPDAPRPQPKPVHHDGFFTFRGDWRKPALRPNKKSWVLFATSQAAMWAAVTYDIKHTHGAREQWHSEAPAVAAITGMDFLAFKFFSPSFSVGPPVYVITHYLRDSVK